MRAWRVVTVCVWLVLVLAFFGVLGFHEPTFPGGLILCAMILWCICDAVGKEFEAMVDHDGDGWTTYLIYSVTDLILGVLTLVTINAWPVGFHFVLRLGAYIFLFLSVAWLLLGAWRIKYD